MSETPESQEWRPQETDPLRRLTAEVRDLRRALRSLTNGILSNAGLKVEPDTLRVLQTLTSEDGAWELDGAGNARFDGDTAIGGDTTISGDTTIDGDATIRGDARVVEGGELQVRDGGRFRVLHPESDEDSVYAGDIYDADTWDYLGTGLLVEMPNGEDILVARTGPGGRRLFSVKDNSDRSVLWVDDDTPRGLTHPTFSIPMHAAHWESWGSTDSTSWTDLARGSTRLWHGGFYTRYRSTSTDAGTAGQVRLVVEYNGVDYVISGPEAVGFVIAWHDEQGALPSAIPISGWVNFRLEGRVTSGTGRVHAAVINLELEAAP